MILFCEVERYTTTVYNDSLDIDIYRQRYCYENRLYPEQLFVLYICVRVTLVDLLQ